MNSDPRDPPANGRGWGCFGHVDPVSFRGNPTLVSVRRLRVRLRGGASLLDPLPQRPQRMHRRRYDRLLTRAMAVQEASIALELDWLRRRRPSPWNDEMLAEKDPAGRLGPQAERGANDGSRRRRGGDNC